MRPVSTKVQVGECTAVVVVVASLSFTLSALSRSLSRVNGKTRQLLLAVLKLA
jgi:hypothetical protein